jgi:ATP-dependent RNA helicase DDX5/DBP2
MLRAVLSQRSGIAGRYVATANTRLLARAAFSSNAAIEGDDADMTPDEFRKANQINLLDSRGRPLQDHIDPILRFDDAPFDDKLKNALLKQGYTSPTPTQAQSWPIAHMKRDMISVARTGSGKTCGFLLPAFQKIIDEREPESPLTPAEKKWGIGRPPPKKSPKALVLAPTRELCVQIYTEAEKFARLAGLKAACMYGGSPKGPQIRQLRQGAEIVIGTPGRVNDMIESGYLRLGETTYFVLDEADRMLDMGFEPQIREVMNCLKTHIV